MAHAACSTTSAGWSAAALPGCTLMELPAWACCKAGAAANNGALGLIVPGSVVFGPASAASPGCEALDLSELGEIAGFSSVVAASAAGAVPNGRLVTGVPEGPAAGAGPVVAV